MATNNTSVASVSTRSTRAAVAVFVMPARLAAVSATTASAAATRVHQPPAGTAYAAKVIAMAAHDAVLPITKPQPARNPHHSPSTSRP